MWYAIKSFHVKFWLQEIWSPKQRKEKHFDTYNSFALKDARLMPLAKSFTYNEEIVENYSKVSLARDLSDKIDQ